MTVDTWISLLGPAISAVILYYLRPIMSLPATLKGLTDELHDVRKELKRVASRVNFLERAFFVPAKPAKRTLRKDNAGNGRGGPGRNKR